MRSAIVGYRSIAVMRERSGEEGFDDMPVHVGEAAVEAVVIVTQFLVIEPEQVQRSGVQVVAGKSDIG